VSGDAEGRDGPRKQGGCGARALINALIGAAAVVFLTAALDPPRAEAQVSNLIATNEIGEPLDESVTTIGDNENLWAYITTPSGAIVCVQRAPVGSEASCDGGDAWGETAAPIFFAGLIPVAPAPLKPGVFQLVAVDQLGAFGATKTLNVSQPFRITNCSVADCGPAPKPDPTNAKRVFNAIYNSMYTTCQLSKALKLMKTLQNSKKFADSLIVAGTSPGLAVGYSMAFVGADLANKTIGPLEQIKPSATPYMPKAIGMGIWAMCKTFFGLDFPDSPLPFVKGFNVVPGPLGGVTRWLQDPPQPYESVDSADFLDFTKFDLEGLEDPDAMGVTRSMDRMRAHLDSGTTAWERFQGAFDAGPGATNFAHAQAAAIDTEFTGLRSALISTAGSIDSLKRDIQADGTIPDSLTQDEIDAAGEIMRRVRDSGFTADEVAALRAIGIDDAGLVQLRDDFGGDVETLAPSTSFVGELTALSQNLYEAREAVDEFARQGAVYAGQTNTPPTASFTTSTSAPSLEVSFTDTSTSEDLDPIVSRVWDFGDGEIAEGETVGHTYAAEGTYTVTLTVSDGTAAAQARQSITVGNRAPTASFISERDTANPLLLRFDGSGSSDPDGDALTYRWDFRDGTTGEGETASHTFPSKGFRVVRLTVSDGTTQTTFEDQVHAGLQDPVARFERTPLSALTPYNARFDASTSSDPEGREIVSYEWDFGDGTSGSGKTTSHLITTPGTRNAFLTVRTADGRTARTGQQVFALGLSDLDLPICGDQGDGTPPPTFRCNEFEPARGTQAFQVPGTGTKTITADVVFQAGAFQNELAVLRVDDANGSIGALAPGSDGYLAAALDRAQTVFPRPAGAGTPDVGITVNGGDRLVFMLISQGSLASLKTQNPTNDPTKGPTFAFFSLDGLNPDGLIHTVTYRHKTEGSVEFGFEDVLGGGDNDFDDIVFRVSGLEPVPGLAVTKTADAPTSTAGATNGYTIALSNTGGIDVPVDSISDSLPAGFSYKPGSSTGATTTDPAVSGGDLRWDGPFVVPAGGTLELAFDVAVASAPGEYLNEANADADAFAVAASGPTAKVTVEGAHDNREPEAESQSLATDEDTAKAITLGASDLDGDSLTFQTVDEPTHGSLSGSGADRTYTPAANYHGPDSFTFKANDGAVDSNVATVSITVMPVNDPPALTLSSASVSGQYSDPIPEVTATASDPDGTGGLTFGATGVPAQLSLSAPVVSADAVSTKLGGRLNVAAGTYPATITVTDATGESDSEPLEVKVERENAAVVSFSPQALTADGIDSDADLVSVIARVAETGDGNPSSTLTGPGLVNAKPVGIVLTALPGGAKRSCLANDTAYLTPGGDASASCGFTDVAVGAYQLAATIGGDFFTGSGTGALSVSSPAPGNRPPSCTAGPAPRTLWPPSHKFVGVRLGGATDPDGDPVSLAVLRVKQDEPVNEKGDGNTGADAMLSSRAGLVYLRAERAGGGDGRIYDVLYMGADPQGASCTGHAYVTVRQSMKKGDAARDSGVRYDSLTGALLQRKAK
jgi:uncharacterized repeat protein (TIGR01451 family)